jgi:hypothetical protein
MKYEEMHFERLIRFLLGYCEACKQEYAVVVDYFQYRKSFFSYGDMYVDCKKCHVKNSLSVSFMIRNIHTGLIKM